ncbi:MAG: flagellar hook capping protein [Chloroflexota bacterium]|nr:MAG: flagellar hook capping protein [Chloroflexota bacterium]
MNVAAAKSQSMQSSGTVSSFKAKQPGQSEFMQLLAAELRNQDPMQPTSDKEFIAQLAQFNVLDQLQQLNATMDAMAGLSLLSQGAALVGKWVEISPNSSAGITEGQVTEVSFKGTGLRLKVGGKTVTLGDIVGIKTTSTSS